MPSTTNFGWTTPADTDYVKDGASAIRTLANGVDTSMAQLKGGTTGQILSKTNGTDMAFTWINNDQGDITGITTGASSGLTGGVTSGTADLKFNTTAKGGMLIGTGSGTVSELAVGTNNYILTADSTQTTGVKWAAASSGGSLTLLSTTTLSGSSTSISSISSSYSDLRFELLGYSTTGNAGCEWRPNGSTTIMSWSGTQNGAFGNADGQPLWVEMGGNGGQNDNSAFVANLYIFRYANTSNYKNFIYTFGSWTRNTGTVYFGGCQGVIKTNSAISSMTLALSGNSFSAGTVKTYGVN